MELLFVGAGTGLRWRFHECFRATVCGAFGASIRMATCALAVVLSVIQ